MGDSRRVRERGAVNPPQGWCIGIILFIFFSLLVVPCFSENVTAPEGTESIISVAAWGTDQTSPAIWEDRVVWTTSYPDPGDPYLYYFDIYLYNPTTGEEQRIPTASGYSDMPDIWEDRIVFQTWEDDSLEIHLFNLSTSEEFRLTTDMINQVKPRIWGDWVVWQEGDDWEPDHGVVLYDISTENTTRIGSSPSAKSPDIWGERIVWDEATTGDGNFDIFLYNITSGNITQVTTDPFAQLSPSIWGDRIVWMDIASQVYLYDLGSGNETQLTSGDFYRESPVISGDYVAYVNDTVVSLIDIARKEEFPISMETTGSPTNNPDIWGDRIVWADMRNGDFDVYLYTIGTSMPPLTADFTANETQGEAPFTVAFIDSTSGQADGWSWDFGDGETSNEQNPDHTYDSDGSFTVTLIVHNPLQRDAIRKTDLISVGSVPVPGFTQSPESGPAPLAVQFTDESSGTPVVWHWDFGDGETSDEQNPDHVYQQPGIYPVNLTVDNAFGNALLEKQDLITVMDGTFHTCSLPAEGITLIPGSSGIRLTLDTSRAGNCTGDSPTDPAMITCVPEEGTGIASIMFSSPAGGRFSGPENGTYTGFLGDVWITSCDLTPLNFSPKAGNECFFNFTLNPYQYDAGVYIHTVVWEGCTPQDLTTFNDIKIMYNYGDIEDLVYTVRFDKENFTATGPASLFFGVSSDWVDLYGWRWCHRIESDPPGAAVFVDSRYIGDAPICIEEGLSPGNHTVTVKEVGYYPKTFPITIDDKRDSIHVIRIGDDGTGEVLNTTFIGHDPERNLDFFQAESPNGLSTFGLASLSRSGNVLQLVNLVVSRVTGSGGGGGGGGSSSSGTSSSAATSLASAQETAAPTPVAPEPAETLSPLPEKPPAPEITALPVDTAAAAEPASPATSEAQGMSPLGSLVEGTSSLIILRNLSVVFVVIFVSVVFYLRWKR